MGEWSEEDGGRREVGRRREGGQIPQSNYILE